MYKFFSLLFVFLFTTLNAFGNEHFSAVGTSTNFRIIAEVDNILPLVQDISSNQNYFQINGSKITVLFPGKYLVSYKASFKNVGNSEHCLVLKLHVNGAALSSSSLTIGPNNYSGAAGFKILDLELNDELWITGFRKSGPAIDCISGPGTSNISLIKLD